MNDPNNGAVRGYYYQEMIMMMINANIAGCILFHTGATLKEAYKTQGKIYPSEEVRKIMKTNMAEAFEFYYFVKQRFHNLLDKLMEGST